MVGPDFNTALMLWSFYTPSDPLTNASHVREVDSGWPLLSFPTVFPQRPGCKGRTDGVMVTIPHENFHEVVFPFLQVQTLLHNAPGIVVATNWGPPHLSFALRRIRVSSRNIGRRGFYQVSYQEREPFIFSVPKVLVKVTNYQIMQVILLWLSMSVHYAVFP